MPEFRTIAETAPIRYPVLGGCVGSTFVARFTRITTSRYPSALGHRVSKRYGPPFGKSLELAYSSDFHCRTEFANGNTKSATSLRRGERQHLREIRTHLLPARQRLVRKLESKAPEITLSIPLIMLLAQQLGYSDKALPRDRVYGGGIVG